MRSLGRVRWTFLLVPVLVWIGCRSGPSEGWSGRARTMVLTSGPAEIVMSSSKVPGYWAREAGTGEEFFLYTSDRSLDKGARITVEGPFGSGYPAVFRDETGAYKEGAPTHVLVVWKMSKEATDRGTRR
jgi:hypothetical protein